MKTYGFSTNGKPKKICSNCHRDYDDNDDREMCEDCEAEANAEDMRLELELERWRERKEQDKINRGVIVEVRK